MTKLTGLQLAFSMMAAVVVAFLSSTASQAQREPWGNPYDALLERPGVEIENGTREDGTLWRGFKTPAGIEISQTKRGDLVSTFSTDHSGHGAVLCLWDIVVLTKLLSEICPELSSPKAEARLETALDRIHRFILQNAVEPVTIEDLETSIQRRRESEQKELTAIEDKAAACRKSDFADLVTAFATAPDEQLEKNLEEDLSLPRIPVKNPCL